MLPEMRAALFLFLVVAVAILLRYIWPDRSTRRKIAELKAYCVVLEKEVAELRKKNDGYRSDVAFNYARVLAQGFEKRHAREREAIEKYRPHKEGGGGG